MTFPRDAGRARQDAEEVSAVERTDREGEENGGDAAFEHADEEQISEKSENDAARADMHRIFRADEPRAGARGYGRGEKDEKESAHPPNQDEPPEHEKRQRISHEVRKIAVQKRRKRDTRESIDVSRVNTVLIERAAEKPVHGLHAIEERDKKAEDRDMQLQLGADIRGVCSMFHDR